MGQQTDEPCLVLDHFFKMRDAMLKEGHCFRENTPGGLWRGRLRSNVVCESGQFTYHLGRGRGQYGCFRGAGDGGGKKGWLPFPATRR